MLELEDEEPAEQKDVGLKILTQSQMLSRLTISLVHLILKNLKMKSDNCFTLCPDQKN